MNLCRCGGCQNCLRAEAKAAKEMFQVSSDANRNLMSSIRELTRKLQDANLQFDRFLAWLKDTNRKPADLAFTAGQERQAAYAVEGVFLQAKEHGAAIEKLKQAWSEINVLKLQVERLKDKYESCEQCDGSTDAGVFCVPCWNRVNLQVDGLRKKLALLVSCQPGGQAALPEAAVDSFEPDKITFSEWKDERFKTYFMRVEPVTEKPKRESLREVAERLGMKITESREPLLETEGPFEDDIKKRIDEKTAISAAKDILGIDVGFYGPCTCVHHAVGPNLDCHCCPHDSDKRKADA